jgi:8-amino-7-oxononanoate synthase
MNSEAWIEANLHELDRQHLRRSTSSRAGAGQLNFASNDYLNLAGQPEIKEAAIRAAEKYGAGSGASRLVSGTLPIHEELEAVTARLKRYPAALLFGSGYLVSIGCIPPLAGRGDVIIADRLVHACLLDGIMLSGAKLVRFRHNDVEHLRACLEKVADAPRKLIVTESVFSMDGDLAPLPDIARLAEEHGAMLMVDEAHATGAFGPRGAGLVAAQNLQSTVNLSMSTFSKALGGYGGIVACSEPMRAWLVNKGRSFIYTTAPPPAVCGAALAAFALLEREPGLGNELQRRAAFFREQLQARGFDIAASNSQIVPVIIGDNETTLRIAASLLEQNIRVGAIRPPTVPAGTARLRFSVTLAHREHDLMQAADALARSAVQSGWSLS